MNFAFTRAHRFAIGLALACLPLFACDDDDDDDDDRDAAAFDAAVDMAPGDAAVDLSDAEIAQVMVVANAAEVQHGSIALSRVSRSAVRDFANFMITQHTSAQQRLAMVLNRNQIAPVDSAFSQQLDQDLDAIAEQLQQAPAAQVDEFYIDSQVTVHMRLLTTLDTLLIPSTQNAELRADLQLARAEIAQHLMTAQQLAVLPGFDGGVTDGAVGDAGDAGAVDATTDM